MIERWWEGADESPQMHTISPFIDVYRLALDVLAHPAAAK